MAEREGTGDKAEDMRQARIINAYITAVQPRRGRPVNYDGLKERLAKIEDSLREDALTPVQRMLKTRDAETIVAQLESTDNTSLEDDFVAIIKDWAERHGIGYGILRQMNVPADVLKRAEIRG